jgi:hypothetical protein
VDRSRSQTFVIFLSNRNHPTAGTFPLPPLGTLAAEALVDAPE